MLPVVHQLVSEGLTMVLWLYLQGSMPSPAAPAEAILGGKEHVRSLLALCRLSPSQVVLGGHHKVPHVSLEDVNPDLFFEGIAEDDAASGEPYLCI